ALEVGIVGLPSSGKTTLFRALTRAETHGSGKEHVGMAQIPDERLEQLAETVDARKATPAAVRVVDVPGTGPQLLGNLRQVDALLVVLDGFSGTRVPADDLETLKLELLVADRDHVERRLERVGKQAKSGDARLKAEAADLERLLAHLDAGRTLAEWEGELPPELDPLTTKPLLELVNGDDGIDLQLEAELAELSPEEATEFRGGGESALGEVVRRLAETHCALAAFGVAGAAAATAPVQVTDDQFAANEESLGMTPDGQTLLGMWNDWHFNDGCGISYSTDGGATRAPESFAPGFTFFTNDPDVPGTGPFAVAGDPVVVYNPRSGLFDVICQSFGGVKGNQIQLLATTFDVSKANADDPANSYGLGAWRLPAVPITTGTANGSQKGSNGKFPDHEAGTIDTGSGPGHHYGRLYLAWAEFNG